MPGKKRDARAMGSGCFPRLDPAQLAEAEARIRSEMASGLPRRTRSAPPPLGRPLAGAAPPTVTETALAVAEPPRTRRHDTPTVRGYARGSASTAVALASDPSVVDHCVGLLEGRMYAPTSRSSRAARAARWEEVATAMGHDPYDLTPELITKALAVLWAAKYRSAMMIADQARDTFLANGGLWTGALSVAYKRARRGVTRGLGPVRHTAAFPMARIPELAEGSAPRCDAGPCGPRRVDLISCWWLLREIEAGGATIGDVSGIGVTFGGGKVTLTLPASKTDAAALGVSRTHTCACGKRSCFPAVLAHDMCPACALIEQREAVVAMKLSERPDDPAHPLFPDASGRFTTKAGMIGSIKGAALALDLPLVSNAGAELWGGHAWRRGGAQWLAVAGVEVWRIQALARHSSTAILGYLEGAHVQAMTGLAAEAAVGRDLSAVRTELAGLRAQVSAERVTLDSLSGGPRPGVNHSLVQLAVEDVLPPPEPAMPAEENEGRWTYVSSTRKGGRVHTVSPTGGNVALCGWAYGFTGFFAVTADPFGPDPSRGAPRCRRCVDRECGAEAAGASSAASDSD